MPGSRRQPEGPPAAPVVQRVRLRYAKRDRLRFTSHRDFARAFERALRRAAVPMAYSAGFTPHPKISYVGAAPTGVASEAEYVEIGLAVRLDLDRLRADLDASLPPGLDVVEVVEAASGGFADRMEASQWRVELPGVPGQRAAAALERFLAADRVPVHRLTKNGRRELDARAPVLRATVDTPALEGGQEPPCAILEMVVRHVTPAVRPDDVLAGLLVAADLELPQPPRALRIAQGLLDAEGRVTDPLAADRQGVVDASPHGAGEQPGDFTAPRRGETTKNACVEYGETAPAHTDQSP